MTQMSLQFEGATSNRTVPRPFLKWVGGKRQLLSHLLPLVPDFTGTYHEPFVGGGALFFALRPRDAILCDQNDRLIRTYRGLRDHAEQVIERLRACPHDRDFYLSWRKQDIDGRDDPDVSVWMIYLNRTGFNGLYRVNRRNQFNVPFGRYVHPLICDEANLRACALALQRAQVFRDDFRSVGARAKPGDFVYFDPPYEPVSATSNFTSYTSSGFGMDDQRTLRDLAWDLKRRGVHVMISNSSAPPIYELYERHFEIHKVAANRKINCRRDRRGYVTELVIR